MKKILSIFIFLLMINIAYSNEIGMKFHSGTWSEVLADAKKQNKYIFVDAYADWCKPCKWMVANVFPSEEVGNFYNENFINYKLDMEKGEGIDFAKKYGVKSYPSYLFFNPEGELVHRSGGSKPTENFIEDGKNALNPEKQIFTLQKKYETGDRSETVLYEYTLALRNISDKKCLELANEYLKTQSEEKLLEEKNWNIINLFVVDIESPTFQLLEKNKDKFAEKFGSDKVNMKITMTKMNYYMSKKKWEEYSKYAAEFADNYSNKDSQMLNQIAWTFYEHIDDKVMLEKAEIWAKKSMEIETGYANADTYAAILYKLGKKDEAIKAAEYAIEIAKKNNEDYKETEALLEKIKASN